MIAGGGTGGHVFPGIAVAEALTRRQPETAVTWVGTAGGLEACMGARLGYPLHTLRAKPLKGRRWSDRARAVVQAAVACGEAVRLVRRRRPDCVIGVGGYASGPVVLTAALMGYPTLIMEQNRIAGVTNRVLGHFARRVCVTYPDSARFFPRRKTVWTGNPIRRRVHTEFEERPARASAEFVVLVFGGSQGARAIDQAVCAALPRLAAEASRLRFIHQVGQGTDLDLLQAAYAGAGISAELSPFIEAIGEAYRQADLVICRAGSSSLTELSIVERPAILVPYPYAADDHQRWNARYFEAAGAAVVIEEGDCQGPRLAREVSRLADDPAARAAMAAALRSLAKPDAAERVAEECLQLCASVHCSA